MNDYKRKSENNFKKLLDEPIPKINLSKTKIKKIKKDFNKLWHGFSKSKINEFRRSLYNIKIQKYFLAPKIKETKNLSLDDGYYKPIKTKSAFSDNYIEHENKGVKDKVYHLENILILSDHI